MRVEMASRPLDVMGTARRGSSRFSVACKSNPDNRLLHGLSAVVRRAPPLGFRQDRLPETKGPRSLLVQSRETPTIPVVFVGDSDPIGLGFIVNLARAS